MPAQTTKRISDEAFDEIEGEEGLGALDEVRRNDDGDAAAVPRDRSGCARNSEEDEEEAGDQQNVDDLRVADVGDARRACACGRLRRRPAGRRS